MFAVTVETCQLELSLWIPGICGYLEIFDSLGFISRGCPSLQIGIGNIVGRENVPLIGCLFLVGKRFRQINISVYPFFIYACRFIEAFDSAFRFIV